MRIWNLRGQAFSGQLKQASGKDYTLHAAHWSSDGKIAAVGSRDGADSSGAPVIECRGHCLAPGFVDMRVELREPGREHEETMQSGSAAAAAGGVTTMVALPNTEPAIDDVALVEFVARRSREISGVHIRTYAAATRGLKGREITEIGLLHSAGAVAFTDANTAISDPLVLRRAFSYARTFDALIVQHPEEPSLAAGGHMTEGETATRYTYAPCRGAAEVELALALEDGDRGALARQRAFDEHHLAVGAARDPTPFGVERERRSVRLAPGPAFEIARTNPGL